MRFHGENQRKWLPPQERLLFRAFLCWKNIMYFAGAPAHKYHHGWCSSLVFISLIGRTFYPAESIACFLQLHHVSVQALAVWERCPATLFMIPGIFLLFPEPGIYWTAHYIVTDQWRWQATLGFGGREGSGSHCAGNYICI